MPGLVLVAGRYEGIDERVLALEIDLEVSIGDYVLSGGELPALVLIDALARLLARSCSAMSARAQQESFSAGLLDWPHYTRPEEYAGRRVPAVLLFGRPRGDRSLAAQAGAGRTWLRRPELIDVGHWMRSARRCWRNFCRRQGATREVT